MNRRCLLTMLLLSAFALPTFAADKPKRVLLVTHSGGFIHDSIGFAEKTLKEIGPTHDLDVSCFRFTGDPDAKLKYKPKKDGPEVETTALAKYSEDYRARTGSTVELKHCGRINAETLKNVDCVLFFTTGNPMTKDELKDLSAWVKAGGAFAGTHCATDTMYGEPAYGDLIGAYFRSHPPGFQKLKMNVEDTKHPAAAGFEQGTPYEDEIYIFKDAPYSRDRLHIIISAEKGTFDPAKVVRGDGDYAISWCREEGKGKVFYTSLGHKKDVWKDERFQKHLVGGLKWAMGLAPGDATPTAKIAK